MKKQKAKSKKESKPCRGCEIAAKGLWTLDEVVHDKGCLFGSNRKCA